MHARHDLVSSECVEGGGGKRGLPRMSKSQWCAAAMQKRSSCRRSNLTYLVPSRAFSPQVSASGGCINLARLQLAAIGKHNHNRALLYGSHFSLSLFCSCTHARAHAYSTFQQRHIWINRLGAARWKIPWSNARLHWLWCRFESACTLGARPSPAANSLVSAAEGNSAHERGYSFDQGALFSLHAVHPNLFI